MLNDLRFRLRSLFRRDAEEDELSEELRFHFDQHVEKLIRSGVANACEEFCWSVSQIPSRLRCHLNLSQGSTAFRAAWNKFFSIR